MAQAIKLAATGELLLLTLTGGPKYGAEIVEDVGKASKGEVFINPGTLYPMLKKLEKQKLIRSWTGDDPPQKERGGKRRVYYELTQEGREALIEAYETRRQLVSPTAIWLSC